MGLRESLQKPGVGVVIILVLLLVAAGLALRGMGDKSTGVAVQQEYFLDLSNGELFAVKAGRESDEKDAPEIILAPPIDAPGGAGMGVRAHVYACGSCASNKQVVYIEKLTDEARKRMLNPTGKPAQDAGIIQAGKRVAEPAADGAEPQWVEVSSEQGLALANRPATMCDGQRGIRCFP